MPLLPSPSPTLVRLTTANTGTVPGDRSGVPGTTDLSTDVSLTRTGYLGQVKDESGGES